MRGGQIPSGRVEEFSRRHDMFYALSGICAENLEKMTSALDTNVSSFMRERYTRAEMHTQKKE